MVNALQQYCSIFAIFTIMIMGFPYSAAAEDISAEPFGFRAQKPNAYGEVNVDPFQYRGNPIEFNSFLIWPNLTLQQEYNDNVLATQTSQKSDFTTVLKPSLIIKKEIEHHEFILSLDTEIRRYWNLNNENVKNYSASFEANIEPNHTTSIPLLLSFRDEHVKRNSQRRASVNDLSATPLRVRSYEFETGINHKPNRLGLSLLGNFRRGELTNNTLLTGQPLIRDNRNMNATKAIGRISYELAANWEPYAEITVGDENFTNETPTAITRNNNLLRLLFGSLFNYKGLVYGFMGAGWEKRSYDSNAIQSATGLSLDSKITWEPQAKTKIVFNLSRQTFEDNEIIAGITETATGLELHHELQRNLFLKLIGGYDHEDFSNSARQDKTLNTGIGIHYTSGPHLQIGADYNYAQRNSTMTGLNLDNNIFMIRAKMAL